MGSQRFPITPKQNNSAQADPKHDKTVNDQLATFPWCVLATKAKQPTHQSIFDIKLKLMQDPTIRQVVLGPTGSQELSKLVTN